MKAELLSRKLVRREGNYYVPTIEHWCPACSEMHGYATEQPFRNGARWTFDGNFESPSFSPSMNISVGPTPSGKVFRCHYFVTAGRIQYCGDCTHEMNGRTIDLPDIPAERLLQMGIS